MLKVFLIGNEEVESTGTGFYHYDKGSIFELSEKELKSKCDEVDAATIKYKTNVLYSDNISNRLKDASREVGLYGLLWGLTRRSGECKVDPLELAQAMTPKLKELIKSAEDIKVMVGLVENPELMDRLIDFVKSLIDACKKNPKATLIIKNI